MMLHKCLISALKSLCNQVIVLVLFCKSETSVVCYFVSLPCWICSVYTAVACCYLSVIFLLGRGGAFVPWRNHVYKTYLKVRKWSSQSYLLCTFWISHHNINLLQKCHNFAQYLVQMHFFGLSWTKTPFETPKRLKCQH